MTLQAEPELGPDQSAVRNILVGIPPRMFQRAREQPAGGALVRARHPQLPAMRLCSGDRVYLCAFVNGRLALLGRLTVDGNAAERGEILATAPFTACRVDRIVPHGIARA